MNVVCFIVSDAATGCDCLVEIEKHAPVLTDKNVSDVVGVT